MRTSKTLVILSIISLILFACEKKDDLPDKKSSEFIFKAEIDNNPWVAALTWGYNNTTDNRITLSGSLNDTVSGYEEALHLVLENEKISIGETMQDFGAELWFILGGDVIVKNYEKTDNPEESYIIITEFDTVNHRIKGEFEVKLTEDRNTEENSMNLKKGEFDMPYEDIDSY